MKNQIYRYNDLSAAAIRLLASLMLFVLSGSADAMGRTVGVVTDADTGEKLSYVTVCAGKGKKRSCVTTDSLGVFVMN